MRFRIAVLMVMLAVCGIAPPATADDHVATRVSVRASGGGAIDSAYIAFHSDDRPSWFPAAEMVAPNGITTLRLAPGVYDVFVVARGRQEAWRSIRIPAAKEITFELAPSVPVGGLVRDSGGSPIPDASVRYLGLSGPVKLGQLSDVARKYLQDEWTTRTDRAGRWQLPGRDGAAIPILVEAPGFAPTHEFRRPGDSRVVTLQRGASLRVECDRKDSDLALTLVLEPRPTAEQRIEGWERIAWTRTAESKTLQWDSIPAGKYYLVAHDLNPRRFTKAVQVGSLEVAKGETAVAQVTLPRVAQADAHPKILHVPGRRPGQLVDLRAFVSAADTSIEVQYAFEPSRDGTLLYLRTDARPDDLFIATTDTVIGARAGASSIAHWTAVLSPRADVSVRVDPRDLPAPRWAAARFGDCEFGGSLSLTAAPSRDHVIDLPFPSSCKTLLLRFSPFEPVLIEASLAPRQKRALGPYVLRMGGQASVRVVREPAGSSIAKATVRVFSFSGGRRQELALSEGVANSEGLVLMDGLPVERDLVFEASDPESGLSGSVRALLVAGTVTSIDPLRVPEPSTLTVTPVLSQRLRERFPAAGIHSVGIETDASGTVVRRSVALNDEGTAVFAAVHPGRWDAFALVEAAGSIQPVSLNPIELHPGKTTHIEPAVEPILFDGRVLAGDAPVAAQVGFGDPPARDAVRRFVRTDPNGRFSAVLPREGLYHVTVTPLHRPAELIDLGDIELVDPGRTVTLNLPSESLLVRVSDDERPVANAIVSAVPHRGHPIGSRAEPVRRVQTDANGEALLAALRPTRWVIRAEDPRSRRNAEVTIDVRSGAQSSVGLDLESSTSLAGRIVDPSSASARASRVDCLFLGPSGIPRSTRAEADDEGRFSLEIPSTSPARIQCGVTTTRGLIGAYSLTNAPSMELVLPAETGLLVIADWGSRSNPDAWWLASPDGRVFNLAWAAARLGTLWSPLTLRLSSGRWGVLEAVSPVDWVSLATVGGKAMQSRLDFEVRPGATNTVHLSPTGLKKEE